MVRKCIVCGEVSNRFSYFKFPRDIELKKKWLEACRLDESKLLKNSFVCSKHFRLIDFDNDSRWPRCLLVKNAVPQPFLKNLPTPSTSTETCEMQNVNVSVLSSSTRKDKTIPTPGTSKPQPEIENVEVTVLSSLTREAKTTAEVPSLVADCSNVSASVTPAKVPRFVGDLSVSDFNSPNKARRNLLMVKEVVKKKTKEINLLKVQKRRLEKRIDSFKSLLDIMRKKQLLSEEATNLLKEEMPDAIKDIINRKLQNKNSKYDPEIRAFALTLHFYSVRAYNYVRKTFNNLLPHPSTIQKWYGALDGRPGFTMEVFNAIKKKTEKGAVLVNLVIDEMSIRQLVQWQAGEYHGFVDFGTGLKSEIEAKNALVFMAVAINGHWKAPVAYFLIAGLQSHERANLVQLCLERLYDAGAECYSITFDGTVVNLSMCNTLGASFDLNNFKPYFQHPITGDKVYTIWDACHMVKLCRNTIGDKGIMFDGHNRTICWSHIALLNETQRVEGLRAATKITNRHIQFQNDRMNVRLAVQVLSASVATALRFCKIKNINGFTNVEATAVFCEIINNAFDILNSRNVFSKTKYSQPIKEQNLEFFISEIATIIEYLKSLHDNAGHFIVDSNRKTGFLGLIVSLTNIANLYKDLVAKSKLTYLLTYKLSQDHIETFFSAVRSRGGFNNNPSAVQFQHAYKRLLVRHQISSSAYGNCAVLDATTILSVSSGTRKNTNDVITEHTIDEIVIDTDHDYFLHFQQLSPFVDDVVQYIAGFVVKKIGPKVSCAVCKPFLFSSSTNSALINLKNRGKLIFPSSDVINICKLTEKILRSYSAVLFTKKHIKLFLKLSVLKNLDSSILSSELMMCHVKSQDTLDNHRVQLFELVIDIYLNLRLHYEAKKKQTREVFVRHKFSNLILFQNQ